MSEISFAFWFPLLLAIIGVLVSVAFVASQIGAIYDGELRERK